MYNMYYMYYIREEHLTRITCITLESLFEIKGSFWRLSQILNSFFSFKVKL